MICVAFHLPSTYPNGEPIHPALLEDFTTELALRCGGVTVCHAFGLWLDPDGDLISEPIYRYICGVDEQAVEDFVQLVDELLKGRFRQQAVWIEVDGKPSIR